MRVSEAAADGRFLSDRRAEYLERLVYVCPFCGLSRFESSGNEIVCLRCRRAVRYGEDKRLTGVGFSFPFPFVNDWYEYQQRFVNRLDPSAYLEKPLYEDGARVLEVILYRRKNLLKKSAALRLYGDRITVDEGTDAAWALPYSDISGMAVIGRNRLNVYIGGRAYQFQGDRRFNAVKYLHLYHRHKNATKGNGHGEFLGL